MAGCKYTGAGGLLAGFAGLGTAECNQLVLDVLAIGAVAYALFFLSVVVVKITRIYQLLTQEKRRAVNPLMIYGVIAVLIAIAWTANELLNLGILTQVESIISLLLIGLFFMGIRYPEILQVFKTESLRSSYECSQLSGIDVARVLKMLKLLMEEEKVFRDEGISLPSLAAEVGLTPHQLSELLNIKLGKNFYGYVNEYRIREAQQLLMDDSKHTVLFIAHEAGFGTPSAFYAAFRKQTGMSPSELKSSISTEHSCCIHSWVRPLCYARHSLYDSFFLHVYKSGPLFIFFIIDIAVFFLLLLDFLQGPCSYIFLFH